MSRPPGDDPGPQGHHHSLHQSARGRQALNAGGSITNAGRDINTFHFPRWVLVLAAAILAAAVLGAGYLLVAPDPVEEYRKQVLATCEQIRSVMSEEHNDALVMRPDLARGNPGDALRVRKDLFLSYTRANIDHARESLDLLDRQELPGELREQHREAKAAQKAWLARLEKDYRAFKRELRDLDPISEVNALVAGSRGAWTRVNAAMTRLAGQDCRFNGDGRRSP